MQPRNDVVDRVLITLVAIWSASMVMTIVAPDNPVSKFLGNFTMLWSVGFALLHGSRRYGWGGTLVFFVLVFVLATGFETMSILTGFPFGFYEHNAGMGPKIYVVPVAIGLGFYSIHYPSWTLANALIGEPRRPGEMPWLLACAVVATFIVVGFDISIDPTGSLVNGLWTFRKGGGLLGIPMSNFVGWYIVAFAIFLAWSIYLKTTGWTPRPVSPGYWYVAAAFWAAQGLQFPLVALAREAAPVVYDSSGWAFRSKDILDSAGLLAIATMVSFAVLTVIVVWRRSGDTVATRR